MKHIIPFLILFFCISGSVAQSQSANPRVYGSAKLNGIMAIVLIPDGLAQRLLPKGLELSREMDFPIGQHPVTLFWGQQSDLRTHIGNQSYPIQSGDLEAIYTITHIRKIGSPKKYSFTAKIFANSRLAQFFGKFYGLPKYLAKIQWSESGFEAIAPASHEPIFEAQAWNVFKYDPNQFQQNLAKIKKGFELPMISVLAGRLVCSDFNWNMDHAEVIPVNAQIKLHPSFIGNPASGDFTVQGLDQNAFGAFSLKTQWTLSLPHGCSL